MRGVGRGAGAFAALAEGAGIQSRALLVVEIVTVCHDEHLAIWVAARQRLQCRLRHDRAGVRNDDIGVDLGGHRRDRRAEVNRREEPPRHIVGVCDMLVAL